MGKQLLQSDLPQHPGETYPFPRFRFALISAPRMVRSCHMKKAALLSVSDKTGLIDFARGLQELGYELLSSAGTARHLIEAKIDVLSIEKYTGQKEILDGRVKTLHPKIHAGLLARRDVAQHMSELESNGISPIDIAVINLYPFLEQLGTPSASDPLKMIEYIDIGGPAMIRAAAKNHLAVLAVIDPTDYVEVLGALRSGTIPIQLRRRLAVKVFSTLANYNLEIARYFSSVSEESSAQPGREHGGPVDGLVLSRVEELRYGENPQQRAAFYTVVGSKNTTRSWEQLGGKQLSYNNLLDFDAALGLVRCFKTRPTALIVKHLNPCGVGQGADLVEALRRAKQGDPRSHFGGIIAFNHPVNTALAAEIREDFAEIVLAPAFDSAALKLLQKNANLRIMRVELEATGVRYDFRCVEGGVLVQERDPGVSSVREARLMTARAPGDDELTAVQFAWSICAHVKSNAIVIARDGMLLAVGAGQMSRVDSAELALSKARAHGHDLHGAVAASDAFFPFADAAECLIKAGITCIIAPAGSKKDAELVAAVDRLGASLLFAQDRHFRH